MAASCKCRLGPRNETSAMADVSNYEEYLHFFTIFRKRDKYIVNLNVTHHNFVLSSCSGDFNRKVVHICSVMHIMCLYL